MGAWAVDAFGNDDAVDWTYGLEGTDDLSLIEAAFDKVLIVGNEEYLEAPDACEALAAVEVVARLQGNWGVRNGYSEPVDNWVEKTNSKPNHELAQQAYQVINRILASQSELRELWQDTEQFDAWLVSIEDLRTRVHV